MSAKVEQGPSKSPVAEVNGLGELNKLNLPEPHSLEQGKKKTTKGRADTGLSEADKKRKEEEAAAAAAAKKAAEEQAQKKAQGEAAAAAKQAELKKPIPFNSTVVSADLQSPFKDNAATLKQLPDLQPSKLTSTSDAQVLKSGSEFYIKTKGEHWTNVNNPKDTRLLSADGKELQRVEVAPVTADEKTTYYYRPEGSKSKLLFTAEQLNVEPSKRTEAILGVGDKFVAVKLATDTVTNQPLIQKPGEKFYTNEVGDVYRDIGQGKFEKLTPTKLNTAAEQIATEAQKKIADADKNTKLTEEQKTTEKAKWEPYTKKEAVPTVYIVQNGENKEVYNPKGVLLGMITKDNKFLIPEGEKPKNDLSFKLTTESGVPYDVKLSYDKKKGLEAEVKTDATSLSAELAKKLKEATANGSTSQKVAKTVSVGIGGALSAFSSALGRDEIKKSQPLPLP